MIRFENENSTLDFKSQQYVDPESLLKDIIAMANCPLKSPKYIVIGVKLISDGSREFHAIDPAAFVDDANYQQLIRENVEPDVNFRYYPFHVDGHLLGVFEIDSCPDPPYMMRRDKGRLRKGDAWIRKGSHQDRLTRRDLDLVLNSKTKSVFDGKIKVGWDSDLRDTIILRIPPAFELPSVQARKRIEGIIRERRRQREELERRRQSTPPTQWTADMWAGMSSAQLPSFWFPGMTYEQMSDEQLHDVLDELKETYKSKDLYYICEEIAHKIQVVLLNESHQYLEDVALELRTESRGGLYISEEKVEKPEPRDWLPRPYSPDPERLIYPIVEKDGSTLVIKESVGDVRHHVPQFAFQVPFRLTLAPDQVGSTIYFDWVLHARNLATPMSGRLTIEVQSDPS